MIYIIPKQFDEKWNRTISYIEKLNSLEIKYNPKKAIFPRLKNSNKRGKDASQEIIKEIGCYMISKLYWLEELCFCLKCKFQIKIKNGKNILFSEREEICNKYFKSHILCNNNELEKKLDEVIQSDQIKEVFLNPVDYLRGHIQNMELNESQKLELIKIILN